MTSVICFDKNCLNKKESLTCNKLIKNHKELLQLLIRNAFVEFDEVNIITSQTIFIWSSPSTTIIFVGNLKINDCYPINKKALCIIIFHTKLCYCLPCKKKNK